MEILETAAADETSAQRTPQKELKRCAAALATQSKKPRHAEENNKEKGSDKKNAKQDPDLDDKKKRNAFLREAASLKEKYLRALAIQATIERQVAEDPVFEWARNETEKQRFTMVKDAMETALAADGLNQWRLVNDLASAKKYGIELFICFQKFVTIKPAVDNLEAEQARFQMIHNANS